MGEIGLPRCIFLWSVASIYLLTFASLYVQIPGLYGNEGIVPARRLVEAQSGKPLLEQLLALPSLLVLGPTLGLDTQQAMELTCLVGALLALGAVLFQSLRSSLVFLILWALFFSLWQVGQDFLRFQWDSLLLEAGFLAVLVAPLWCGCASVQLHDSVTFWLTRWLLFRVTLGAGVAKLAGGETAWWDLSALSRYFESQVSPNILAWYCHQLPSWLLKLGVVIILETELVVPFLFFAPIRCLRIISFYLEVFLQLSTLLTGNLSVMNLLTIALSFSLLDDEHILALQGQKKSKKKSKSRMQKLGSVISLLLELGVLSLVAYSAVELFHLRIDWEQKALLSETKFTPQQFAEVLKVIAVPSIWVGVLSLTWEVVAALLGGLCMRGVFSKLWTLIQWTIFTAAAACMFALTVVPFSSMERVSSSKVLPEVRRAYNLVKPYGLVNAYGLDLATLAEDGRPEVILEGSMDQEKWTEIDLMYKPGKESQAPLLVTPHQPRLDWQLWRAAHKSHDHSPWFTGLVQRLLQGKKDVVRLLQMDEAVYPFSQSPPTFIRAGLYKYWFTEAPKDGSHPQKWWRRHYVQEFYPAVRLGDPKLDKMLSDHGLKEKHPVQHGHASPVGQVLEQLRSHVAPLPGPTVLLALFASVATICLVKALVGHRAKGSGGVSTSSTPSEGKGKKAKESQHAAADKNKSKEEKTQDSLSSSPRKRRK